MEYWYKGRLGLDSGLLALDLLLEGRREEERDAAPNRDIFILDLLRCRLVIADVRLYSLGPHAPEISGSLRIIINILLSCRPYSYPYA